MDDRVALLAKALADLCEAIILDQRGESGNWGHPTLIGEASRIRDEMKQIAGAGQGALKP
jgi:hypothetical protein